MTKNAHSWDLARVTLAVLLIGVLISASFWILRPFLPALIWSTMIVVATWPIMLRIQGWLWGKRSLAVMVMTVGFLLLFVVPFSLAIGTIVEHADAIAGWWKFLATQIRQPPPEWLDRVPWVGPKLATTWQQISSSHMEELTARLSPYVGSSLRWFVNQVGGVAVMFIYFLLTVAIAGVMYSNGEKAAEWTGRLARRIAGPRGEHASLLAGQAIRAVALGIIVTALVQSALSWIGLTLVGMPYATLLTALIFMLVVAQVGPALVLLPAVIWLYWKDQTAWAAGLLVWTVFIVTLDNFLRPLLIKRGADLPLLLIFAGVIGGLMAFGIIGIFIGPVVLAVSSTLLAAWVREEEPLPESLPHEAAAQPEIDSDKGEGGI